MEPPEDIDTADTLNRFLVSVHAGSGLVTAMMLTNRRLSKPEIANLCAWLLAVGGVDFEQFKTLYENVCRT